VIIDLLPTDEQSRIVDSVRSLLSRTQPLERLRESSNGAGAAEHAAWDRFVALGLFGLGLDEVRGGVGYCLVEEALVCREFGRVLVSPTVIATMLATHIAADAGDSAALAAFIAGTRRATFANPLHSFTLDGVGGTLAAQLMDAREAHDLVIWDATSGALFPAHQARDRTPAACIDETIALERAVLPFDAAAGHCPAADGRLPRHAGLLISAYLVGIAEAARDMAVAYAGVRVQFGQPIGGFQAVKHACADMAVRAEAAYAQVFYAAVAAGEPAVEHAVNAASARLLAGRAAIENAKANIQVHGGMGFTFECDAHHFLKRALVFAALNFSPRDERSRLLGAGSS
jgi:alkylation response protein AidB-like acyl-CoA dehydrogenase